jgi:hypothetical protein
MLQPTIYIPSRLTRVLATPQSASELDRFQEPCRLVPVGVSPIVGRLCPLVSS